MEVGDAGAASGFVGLDAGDHAVGADLHPVLERVGDVGDERGRLGVHLAALQAVAAVDAVWTVPEAAVGDPDGTDAHLDAKAAGAFPGAQRAGADRVRAVRIAVRVPPRPPLPGDGQLALQALVVGLELLVGDRPVGCHPVAACDLEVRGVKARGVAGVVDHRAADAAPGVVLAELHGVLPADYPWLGPVQRVGAGLVGDPVGVWVPERPGLQHEDLPASAGQALGERGAAGARADDQHVNRVFGFVAAHALAAWDAALVWIEQERRVVFGRAQRALERHAQLLFHSTPRSFTSDTGSTANSGGDSQCSRCSGPRRAKPRG